MASRYRGECVSTPHQGRAELHRDPTRVLRLSRVPSCSSGDPSPECKARFLVNGSHRGGIVGRLDSWMPDERPQGLGQLEDLPTRPVGFRGATRLEHFQQPLHLALDGPHIPGKARARGCHRRPNATSETFGGPAPARLRQSLESVHRARLWLRYRAADAPNTAAAATWDTRCGRSSNP
jgi:hypothetical protein